MSERHAKPDRREQPQQEGTIQVPDFAQMCSAGTAGGGRVVVLAAESPEFIAVNGRFDATQCAQQFKQITPVELTVGLPLHRSWIRA